jgi:hypothetical protein
MILMASMIIGDVIGFTATMFILVLAFCKMYTVNHLAVNDPSGQYSDVGGTFAKLMIQTYLST